MERLTIGIFGRVNSGKSTMFNELIGQNISVTSEVAGTTTDLVKKLIEIPKIGKCQVIDTPGYDDESELGILRTQKTNEALRLIDIALLVGEVSETFINELKKFDIPYEEVKSKEEALKAIERLSKGIEEEADLTGGIVKRGEKVLLIMPQDSEAPKRRLIKPQVEVIRNLLDKGCIITCVNDEQIGDKSINEPDLIITDSSVLSKVEGKYKGARITTFSLLYANAKGDMKYFLESANKFNTPLKNILIAEACSHIANHEDISKVKLPKLLKKRYGEEINIQFVNGNDFFEDLTPYDLIIHCGGCMLTRKQMKNRIKEAKRQEVAMTNYAIAFASLQNILSKVELPC